MLAELFFDVLKPRISEVLAFYCRLQDATVLFLDLVDLRKICGVSHACTAVDAEHKNLVGRFQLTHSSTSVRVEHSRAFGLIRLDDGINQLLDYSRIRGFGNTGQGSENK